MTSLTATAARVIADAVASENGRSSDLLVGGSGNALRQVIIGLDAQRSLNEHENPGEATLQVLSGRVRLHSAGQSWELSAGDWAPVPSARHGVDALEDSAILLTVAKT
jgi:quercetin dioxygenase-like cupin family protein